MIFIHILPWLQVNIPLLQGGSDGCMNYIAPLICSHTWLQDTIRYQILQDVCFFHALWYFWSTVILVVGVKHTSLPFHSTSVGTAHDEGQLDTVFSVQISCTLLGVQNVCILINLIWFAWWFSIRTAEKKKIRDLTSWFKTVHVVPI